ncbi:hypothetical protein HDU83_007976 [Entophlyctis luteolus]|nr:hypothetical protein HDU83_007976 [Entophlyctis luteolus]
MAYKSLVAAFAQLVNWTSYLGIKPLQGFSSSDTLSSFQYREWVQTLKIETEKTEKLLRNCLEELFVLQTSSTGFSSVEGVACFKMNNQKEAKSTQAVIDSMRFNLSGIFMPLKLC